jgi:hypothetical protein
MMKVAKGLCLSFFIGILLLVASACSNPSLEAAPTSLPTSAPASTAIPTLEPGLEGLTPEQVAALRSLEKVADYPLYTMHLSGTYPQGRSLGDSLASVTGMPAWGCSLFAALGDPQSRLYGRNFDWEFSPALLLFASPSDGYASVAMVNLGFLGFSPDRAKGLDQSPLSERKRLLDAANLPIDGMNAKGLAVGMAAVPPGNMQPDPNKEAIGSLMVIREMLDHAATVAEAVKILSSYNVDMAGGPPVHYLIADVSGQASLVEFYQGEMIVSPNNTPWHLATNFLVASTNGKPEGQCWRYDAIQKSLNASSGKLSPDQSLKLLDQVHQDSTQWSVSYNLSTGEAQVALGHVYKEVYRFQLEEMLR